MNSIRDALSEVKGCKIVSLTYRSIPAMNKGGRKSKDGFYPNRFFNSFGESRVYKVSRLNGIIGSDYEKVTQKRTGDKEFKVEELWGGNGEHIDKYLVKHKISQKVYLAFLLNRVIESGYYWATGEKLTDQEVDELKSWFSEKRDDYVVEWRTLPVDNILELKMDGEVIS